MESNAALAAARRGGHFRITVIHASSVGIQGGLDNARGDWITIDSVEPGRYREKTGEDAETPVTLDSGRWASAARRIGVAVCTLAHWHRAGKIAAQLTKGGQRRYPESEIRARRRGRRRWPEMPRTPPEERPRPCPSSPQSDRDLIRRAREISPTVTMVTLRRLVSRDAEADNELVLHEALGIAGWLLAELADRLEQVGGLEQAGGP